MNNKFVSDDDLPDGWIKKQCRSRPGKVYYFNTSTKESQWTLPDSTVDKRQKKEWTRKEQVQSPKENGKRDGNRFKLSDNSKRIKKRQSSTPAQDRLQSVGAQLKNTLPTKDRSRNVAEQLGNATPAQSRLQKLNLMIVCASEKLNRSVKPGKLNGTVEHNKPKVNGVRDRKTSANKSNQVFTSCKQRTSRKNETTVVKSTDEIPTLFPPRTPGQERLNRLRQSLNPTDNERKPNESSQQALSVIRSEFGLTEDQPSSDNNNQSTSMDMDEPMDWEPCDIFDEVENVVVNEFIKPYIIPDTNVLLDELTCIRDSIHKDTKYNVLVPFVVLQELDRLKGRQGDARLSNLASGAIRFIYNELKSKTQRLQGQKATEDCMHLIDVGNADDKILNCCLQILRQPREAILITNDINLCNKAMASGITAMTSKEYKAIN